MMEGFPHMDWNTLGTGGGAGFITAILTLLGWNRRLTRLEEEKLGKDEFKAKHETVTESIRMIREDINKNYIIAREDMRDLKGKVDSLFEIKGKVEGLYTKIMEK